MEKIHSSPLAMLFPWLAPLVIKFALVHGGIEVQLYKNNRLIENWQASKLRHVLPEPLIKWIDDNHISMGPQPYPLIKWLWQNIAPLASKKFIIDSSVLAELKEVSQPRDFGMVWELNRSSVCIEGRYEGADHYLGMGWFHKGAQIWPLNNPPSNAIDSQLKNLTMPVQQADFLLNQTIPYLQRYLPTRANFQLITDFAPQVMVSGAHNGGLTFALQCNYPQFLPTIQVPQQKVDLLLANQAIIRFPHQALTPVMIQLLQSRSPLTIQGADVPLFISEQLLIMRQYHQIRDDIATQITQAHPIVSIATLKPAASFVHTYENGIGKYTATATYQYQQHTLNMDALLAAHQRRQRFVQQHSVWFEWPQNARDLVHTIQQQRASQVLRSEEVMGFDTRRTSLFHEQQAFPSIQPQGETPFTRGKSLFEQLRLHGIPGGIFGEPKGFRAAFVDACEHLMRSNRQAHILWLVPSNKKGSATNALKLSTWISPLVTVASLVTLRDEPVLIARPWTLVIFQELDHLLDGSVQSRMLPQLKWQWALMSATSKYALRPSSMSVLHFPERYYEQFRDRFLFDLEKSYSSVMPGKSTTVLPTAQPATPITPTTASTLPKKEEAPRSTVVPPPAPAAQTPHITVLFNAEAKQVFQISIQQRIEEQKVLMQQRLEEQKLQRAREALAQTLHSSVQPKPETRQKPERPLVQPGIKPVPVPETARPKLVAPSPKRYAIELNQQKIVKLHEESELLQDRLTVEDEQEQPQFAAGRNAVTSAPMLQPAVQLNAEAISKLREESEHLQERLIVEAEEEQEQLSTPDPAPAVLRDAAEPVPEVDEDWQLILQQWKTEHWEIITFLYQEQTEQLSSVAHKVHRPVSLLIDEINVPVAEQLEDYLVDPETQTLSSHLHEVAEKLVRWYLSSQGR